MFHMQKRQPHSEETAGHTASNKDTDHFGSATLNWIKPKEIQKRVKVMIYSHVICLRSADIKDRSGPSHLMWFGCMVIREDTVWAINRKVMVKLYVSSPRQYTSKTEMAWSTVWLSRQKAMQQMNLSHLKVSNICPQHSELEIKHNLHLCVLILWPGCHMKRLEGSLFRSTKFNSPEIMHFATGSMKQTFKT